MRQQMPFLDDLKQELLEHAPHLRSTGRHPSRRPRLSGVWAAVVVFGLTLLVGGLTWILAGGRSLPPANTAATLDTFSSDEVTYEFIASPNQQGANAPCIGVSYEVDSGTVASVACPTEESEETEYAGQIQATPWTFVVGYGLQPGETIEVDDATRVVTTEEVNGRRFFLIQFSQAPAESFEVPVIRSDGTTRFILTTEAPDSIEPPPNPTDTTTPSLPEGAIWSAPGIGMTDAFFPEGRVLASDGEHIFVADGHGSLDDSPRQVTAISPDSGSIVWQQDFGGTIQQGVFAQAVSRDRLLVSLGEARVVTLDTATGQIVRQIELPGAYEGAGAAIAVEDAYLLGTHVSSESNADLPPVIMSLNFDDGSFNWDTPLAEGTDLQPITPAYSEGTLIVTSSASHPGSADGNVVHALDTSEGRVLWSADLGGDQQFKFFPSLIVGDRVIVSGPDGAVALSIASGEQIWTNPNAEPLGVGPEGTVYGYAQDGVVTFDMASGEITPFADVSWSPDYAPVGLLFIENQIVVSDADGSRAFSEISGEPTWDWLADPGAIVDFPILASDDTLAVPIGIQEQDPPADRKIVGVELP